jgi:hypothetical protein
MHRDNAQQITQTAGTGDYELSGTVENSPVLAIDEVCVSGKKYRFKIERAGSEVFEVVEGTYTSGAPSTVSRDRLIQSSTGAPIAWPDASNKIITLVAVSEDHGPVGWRHHTIAAAGGPISFTGASETPAPVLVPGLRVTIVLPQTNGDGATFNLNGLGAKAIRKDGTTLAVLAGEMPAGAHVDLTYDAADVWVASNFRRPAPAGVKVVTADTYAVVPADIGQLLYFTHASGCDVAFNEAIGAFATPFWVRLQNASGGDLVVDPASSSIDGLAAITIPKNAGADIHSGGGHYYSRRDNPTVTTVKAPVRQCTLSSAVNSDGLPNFISAGTGLSVNLDCSPTPLVVTAAAGFDANGAVDRIGIHSSDTSISALTANATNYLYADVAADGTVTFGKTTLAPIDQWGGTYSITNGQFTFNIGEMVGKVGDGSAAQPAFRVFIGEAVTDASSVTSVRNYALRGAYVSPWTATLPGTNASVQTSHNIGFLNRLGPDAFETECTTADNGYAIGDRLVSPANNYNGGVYPPIVRAVDRNTISIGTGGFGWTVTPKAGGNSASLTVGSWKYRFRAKRGW